MIEKKKTICSICNPNSHCGLNLHIENGEIIKTSGMPEHKHSKGKLCSKGAATRQYVYSEDRLKSPMKRVGEKGSGQFEEISWEEAYSTIVEKFGKLKNEGAQEKAVFFVGYTKWIRPFVQRLSYSYGSPNYCTESCTCSKATIMSWVLNYGGFPTPDLKNTNLLLVWSANPFYSNTTLANTILAKKESGMKIIVVDPRVTPMASQADIHLRLRPGTDGALALAIANVILSEGLFDKNFTEKYMHGFDEYRKYVMSFTPEKAEILTGIPKEDIIRAARMYAETKPAALMTSASPVVHHTNGLQNYRAVMLLPGITGNIDVEGGNVFASEYPNQEEEYIAPPDSLFEAKPRIGNDDFPVWMGLTNDAHGGKLYRQILSGEPYPIEALLAFGLNFRMWPDSEKTISALKKLDFFVLADMFYTDTSKYADILLPVCTSVERSEFKLYPSGYALFTEPAIEPLFESKSDTDVIFELAKHLAADDELMQQGYEENLNWILEPGGMKISEIRKHKNGLMLPVSETKYKKYESHGFNTPSGKAECVSEVIKTLLPSCEPLPKYEPSRLSKEVRPDVAKEYPFILNTGSRLPMYQHSETFRLPWIRSLRSLPSADINPEDALELGLSQGDWITIATPKSQIKLKTNISNMILPGVVSVFHDYPDADVNSLIDDDYLDPISGFPGFKSLLCKIEKVEA